MHRIGGKLQYYGFENHIPDGKTAEEVRDELVMQPGVRFAAVYPGPWYVFAAAEFPSLAAAQRAIGGAYAKAGFRTDWSQLLTPSRITAPKRGSPRYSAIVQVAVDEAVEDVLGRIDDRFEERSKADPRHARFFYGGAVVSGTPGLLVEFGHASSANLWPLVKELRSVRGVADTTSSFADLLNNAKLAGGRPWKPTPASAPKKAARRTTRRPRRRR